MNKNKDQDEEEKEVDAEGEDEDYEEAPHIAQHRGLVKKEVCFIMGVSYSSVGFVSIFMIGLNFWKI